MIYVKIYVRVISPIKRNSQNSVISSGNVSINAGSKKSSIVKDTDVSFTSATNGSLLLAKAVNVVVIINVITKIRAINFFITYAPQFIILIFNAKT